jgi:hypothetical protein
MSPGGATRLDGIRHRSRIGAILIISGDRGKMLDPLPEPLRYLQPFSDALAAVPPEKLNEDVDASRLERALRTRVARLDEEGAEAELAKDREVLQQWLETRPDHPAHWILGFLLSPDIAAHLTQPVERPARGPRMVFHAPAGWKVKAVPFRLDLKAGTIIGSITAINQLSFEHLQWQREQAPKTQQPAMDGFRQPEWTSEVTELSSGQVSGKKYSIWMAAPVPWKRVDYVLRVPGGFVTVFLGTMKGEEFDELPLEAKLHTLRLAASS